MKFIGVLQIGVTAAALFFGCQIHSEGTLPNSPSSATGSQAGPVKVNPLRDPYYGDLHLHTSYSFDAFILGSTSVDPDHAYRFAKGEVIDYLGQPIQRRWPLDFMAVTDHSEGIGVFNQLENPASVVSQSDVGRNVSAFLKKVTGPNGLRDFGLIQYSPGESDPVDDLWRNYFKGRAQLSEDLAATSKSAWSQEIEFANKNYEPGKFTTFIAYEWSSQPNAANIHRNVIFKGDTAPYPFTAIDSENPEDLWHWLDTIRQHGFEALAIPHNANASNGLMYNWVTSSEYMDRAYAKERQANEPLSEIAQNKGASETHPLLSPSDEFANFEIHDYLQEYRHQVGRLQGSYLRDALSAGLVIQRRLGVNPFKYGFVGGSDLHTGLSVSAQADFAGNPWIANMGGGKRTREQIVHALAAKNAYPGPPELRLGVTAGNLTGIWAESNTRQSLYDALRRRETFATSGTKLRFRFFGAWSFPKDLLKRDDWVATAYTKGVSMGGDLPAKPVDATAPAFAIWAEKDPNGGNLDRAQVVKVWEEGGSQRERIFEVAWSGDRHPDSRTGKLPPVGNTVHLKAGTFDNSVGAVELKTVWKDPTFDPHHLAAYYLRVLEIPTPRWSTLLTVQYGLPLPQGVPATEQQRGWSSPIWYIPSQP